MTTAAAAATTITTTTTNANDNINHVQAEALMRAAETMRTTATPRTLLFSMWVSLGAGENNK